MKKIRTLIADDHAIVRMGLSALLEAEPDIEIVGEAEDGTEAVKMASRLRPDVVVMDLMMPVLDGIAATERIHAELPDTKVLILTTSASSDDLARALSAGAVGALLKSSANDKLIAAIHTVANSKRCVSSEITEMIRKDPPILDLTDRQREILGFITKGLTNQDIARQLGIREDSVKEHLYKVFNKIGAANRAEAVAIALRKHLLKI